MARAAAFALVAAAVAGAPVAAVRAPLDWVDPLIGTGGHLYGVGGDPPGAQVPFGLVKFSPDTTPADVALWLDFQRYSGAAFEDHYVNTFSVLHMVGPGALDLGALGIMPVGDPHKAIALNGAKAKYSHGTESARPGHYIALLTPAGSEQQVQVELTATSHVAIMQLTPKPAPDDIAADKLSVLIDLRHVLNANRAKNCSVTVDSEASTISGHMIDDGGLSGRSPSSVPGQGGLDLWFHAVFPQQTLEPSCTGLIDNGEVVTAAASSPVTPLSAGGNVSAFACVRTAGASNASMVVVVGISTVSAAHAVANIAAEGAADKDFDSLVAAARAQWTDRMAVFEVVEAQQQQQGGSSEAAALPASLLTPWWTAVYHTLMGVSTYSEAGGDYISFDGGAGSSFGTVKTLPPSGGGGSASITGDRQLSDMSIWDTHRSWNPLMVLTQPDIAIAVVRSLARMTVEGGTVPRWPLAHGFTGCMIGNHAAQLVLDSWVKGLRDFDVDVLWSGLLGQARFTNNTNLNRADLRDYLTHGYCISDPGAAAAKYAASCTLSYAFDDWALSQLSAALGKDPTLVSELANRSKSYRNVWEPNVRYFCPRNSSGAFECPSERELAPESWITRAEFGGDKIRGYVEGDAAQWRWFVPGDVPGMIALFGGNASFTDELEAFFENTTDLRFAQDTDVPNPYYWAGNEPGILAPWLGSLAGRPDLTAKFTRWVLDTYFTTMPNGIPGNDDFGTMSAWAVFGWLGFYPLTGTDTYMLGSPRFPHVRIKPYGGDSEGPTLEIVAHGASSTAIFVQGCTWNGVNLTQPVLSHKAIAVGGVLECWMTPVQSDAAWVQKRL